MSELAPINKEVDVEVNEEYLAKLKGFMGFEETDKFPYTPKVFRQKDKDGNFIFPKKMWPIFYLVGKDGIEASELQDDAGYVTRDSKTGQNKIVLQGGKQRLDTIATSVKGWKNWFESDFKTAIPFDAKKDIKNDRLINDKLKKFPIPLQEELQEAINERDTMTKEELTGLEC